jgi:acetyl esterase/lipase
MFKHCPAPSLKGVVVRLLGLCVLSLAAHAGSSTASATAPDPEDYSRPARISSFTVSPSNRHAAFLVNTNEGRLALAVVDLVQPGEPKVIAGFNDADVHQVLWVNDRRLVYQAHKPGAYAELDGGGTFAINVDGKDARQLVAYATNTTVVTGTKIHQRVLPYGWFPWRATNGRSDEILIFRYAADRVGETASARQIARLNTVTGTMTPLSYDQPAFADGWFFDSDGDLRVVTSNHQGIERLYHREPGQPSWTLLEEHPGGSDQVLQPLYIERDGVLIVSTRRGRDTEALFTYDIAKRQLGAEPLVAVDGYDVDRGFVADEQQRQVVGVRLQTSQTLTVWFDDSLASAQKAVDAALPKDRSNLLICGRCVGAERFIVRSSGPRLSAEYLVYDRRAGRLTSLGKARPWLAEDSQGQRSFHRVKARDGLVLPVVMTHPAGKATDQPLPTVMWVHGGPWVRGTDVEWDAEPQFLAALGYRVIEVDFRGSTGLGWKHYQAGWQQWGRAMQDDLADALAWAVASKAVDPQRVCIGGSSYGGYAALMGPVSHPGLYRCAISHAGVTDLNLLFSGRGTDIPQRLRRYGQLATIGDPAAEADQFKRYSPVHRVADIKVPVLLAQGQLDSRVTPVHADRFASAARAAGVELERANYTEEVHGWIHQRNHTDFLTRVRDFLGRHIGSAATAAPPAAATTASARE